MVLPLQGSASMPVGYEIERKYLVEFPDIGNIDICRKTAICQTYLSRSESGLQRRVRFLEDNGTVSYTYTEKRFLTAVTREEKEYSISREEYERLLNEADHECVPVQKVRFCFEFGGQLFELDTYPFSDKLAILETELENPDSAVKFPEYINIIKEVSADERYSNASLACAGKFPEDINLPLRRNGDN